MMHHVVQRENMHVVSENIYQRIVRVVLLVQHDIIVSDEHFIIHHLFSEELDV